MVNEVEQNTYGNIEVKYTRPKTIHRFLANFIDIFFFAVVFIGMFILSRYAIGETPHHKAIFNSVNKMRIESGMYYKKDNGEIVDVITYINTNDIMTNEAKVKFCENRISDFFTFESTHVNADKYSKISNDYDEHRLNATFKENDVVYNLFVLDSSEEIVKNAELYEGGYKYLYRNFYAREIDRYFQGYLATTPAYYDAIKILTNYLVWVEVPIAIVVSVILVYYVPTLFFRRGRKTLGKALYRIGTVDSRFLSPTFGRNLAKWSLFLLEVILGIASIGVIFLISLSMMVFSKNRQGFTDYMLGLQEVDVSKNKIYFTYEEIELKNVDRHKKPTDFRMIERF